MEHLIFFALHGAGCDESGLFFLTSLRPRSEKNFSLKKICLRERLWFGMVWYGLVSFGLVAPEK